METLIESKFDPLLAKDGATGQTSEQFDAIIENGLGEDRDRLMALGGSASAFEVPYGADQMVSTPFEGETAVALGSGTTGTVGGDSDT